MRVDVDRPPLPVLLRYRLLGLRVPDRWLPWVTDDLSRPGWLARGHAWVALAPVIVVGIGRVAFDVVRDHVGVKSFVVLWVLIPLAVGFVLISPRLEAAAFYRRLRERILAYQSGDGPHPTFGAESPRAAYVWIALISGIALAVVLLRALL